MFKKFIFTAVCLFAVSGVLSAQDFSNVQIETIKITDNIFMLKGAGGNIGLCTGSDGAFLIDDQFAPLHDKINAAITAVTDKPVKFLLNTHFHHDHTGGNELIGEEGAVIVAQENVRKRLMAEQVVPYFNVDVPPASGAALPMVTFTTDLMFHMNNDDIDVFHVKHAHTDGDAVVYFKNADVLHAGDIFFQGSYPFVDHGNGGSVKGLIAAMETILGHIDDNTKIIPGHGNLSNKAEFLADYKMVDDVYKKVADMVGKGMTLDQIKAAAPTKEYDSTYNGSIPADDFIGFIYEDFSK